MWPNQLIVSNCIRGEVEGATSEHLDINGKVGKQESKKKIYKVLKKQHKYYASRYAERGHNTHAIPAYAEQDTRTGY
ncbi:MAG: hypothetical protein PVS3B1_05560 [Ktedonobacteraceae bacterium]